MEPPPSYPPGSKIGGYVIEHQLGIGGMGEVYLAEQTSMKRPVALKILQAGLANDSKYLERFFREVRMLAQIEHPNVVSAIEAGVDNDVCYFSMAYVPGKDIKQMLDGGKVLSEIEALRIIEKVAIALEYVWRKYEIIHRDVKPANIMLTPEGDVKLMDLGISKTASERSDLTLAGMMVGSPTYVSPEQARAEKNLDFRADMYSLAASYYHMLTGEPPYEAENPMGVISRHIADPIPDPRQLKSEISANSNLLIRRMMAKKKEDRFPSWKEALAKIRAIREELDGLSPDSTSRSPLPSLPSGNIPRQAPKDKAPFSSRVRSSHRIIALLILLVLFLMALGSVVQKSIRDERYKKADKLYKAALGLSKSCQQAERSKVIKMFEDVQRIGEEEQILAARKALIEFRRKVAEEMTRMDEEKKDRALVALKKKSYELELDNKFSEALELWENYLKQGEYKDDRKFISAAKSSSEYLLRKQKEKEDGLLPE